MNQINKEEQEMEDYIDMMENANSGRETFYDQAEQNGTLIYFQCDGDGNEITAEDY